MGHGCVRELESLMSQKKKILFSCIRSILKSVNLLSKFILIFLNVFVYTLLMMHEAIVTFNYLLHLFDAAYGLQENHQAMLLLILMIEGML